MSRPWRYVSFDGPTAPCGSGPHPHQRGSRAFDRTPSALVTGPTGPGGALLDFDGLLFTVHRGGTVPKLDQEARTPPPDL